MTEEKERFPFFTALSNALFSIHTKRQFSKENEKFPKSPTLFDPIRSRARPVLLPTHPLQTLLDAGHVPQCNVP